MAWPVIKVGFEDLIGRTLILVERVRRYGGDAIQFTDAIGWQCVMCHDQDCCETVLIDDVVGDLSDLVGSKIVMAECSFNKAEPPRSSDDSCTWSFYKFATAKGYVTVRWYGGSNGYYSESAYLYKFAQGDTGWVYPTAPELGHS